MASDEQDTVGATTEVEPEDGPDLSEAFGDALDSMKESMAAFTRAADPEGEGRQSGSPMRRDFVPGGSDPRDRALCEQVVGEDVAWTGRIFSVDRLQVRLPDGRDATRDVVRHPGAVAVIALTDDGRICLVRQYRPALGRVTVEIPAGKLDRGEDPLDCAVRELREETGMVAQHMAFLTTIATSDGFCDELIHLYMATGLAFDQSDPDADEFINVDLIDLPELIDAVLDGRVEDAKTVVGALICDAVGRRLSPGE